MQPFRTLVEAIQWLKGHYAIYGRCTVIVFGNPYEAFCEDGNGRWKLERQYPNEFYLRG